MDGIFVNKRSKKMDLLLMLGGLLVIALTVFLGWKTFTGLRGGKLILGLMVWCIAAAVYGVFALKLSLSNRGAYLHMAPGGISARYGIGKKLECKLEDINYASVGPAMLTLEVDGVIHDIVGLGNVGELAQWLKKQLPFVVPKEEKEDLLTGRILTKQRRKQHLIFCSLSLGLAIVNIFLLKWLTGGRKFSQFAGMDLVYAGIFILAEAIVILGAVWFAGQAGKAIRQLAVSHDKLRCLTIAKTPLPAGDAIGVFYDGYAVRLTLMADPEDRIYYITEKMNGSYALEPRKTSKPSEDTTEVDETLAQMRDIGFLFGME